MRRRCGHAQESSGGARDGCDAGRLHSSWDYCGTGQLRRRVGRLRRRAGQLRWWRRRGGVGDLGKEALGFMFGQIENGDDSTVKKA
jgi:hypothetical protein